MMKELLPNIHQATTIQKVAGPIRVPAAMFVIKSDEETILIDPFELPKSEVALLETIGTPTLTLITGVMHVRDADAYRKRYGAKILVNREAVPKVGIAVDDVFGDGETLPGGLTTIEMPGTGTGETIFRHNQGEGTLIAGDALMNLSAGERGLLLRLLGFPENLGLMPKLLMKNKKRATESYQKLLDYDSIGKKYRLD